MNLLFQRFIVVGVPVAPARRRDGVWLHAAVVSADEALISGWIDQARGAEWRLVQQTNQSVIERLRALQGRPEKLPGKTWPELVNQLLTMEPAQLVDQPELDSIKELAPLIRLAGEVVARRSVIGFLQSSTSGTLPAAKIARELAERPRLLEDNSVSFIRLRSRVSNDVVDASDQAFDELMRQVMSQLTSVTPNDHSPKEGPRLLIGETGAGKSELARALHEKLRAQTGRSGAFKSVNIAAVSPSLLEARLRGYLKGSFTDAKADQKGWFELANGGTLFLDEIQAAPMDFQVQLLDLLSPVSDTVEVEPIGAQGGARKRFRVRVIMATNESEASLLAKGRLRKDLAYRIRTRMELKPLAQRLRAGTEGDLLIRLLRLHRWRSAPAIEFQAGRLTIAEDDLKTRLVASILPSIDRKACGVLEAYDWPGNLREFERVCFDAFLEYDRTGSPDWVSTFQAAIGVPLEDTPIEVAASDATQARMAREIEALLVANEFNVSAIQSRLAVYKKKSPPALKKFLRTNKAHLDLGKWASRKAQALLKDVADDGR